MSDSRNDSWRLNANSSANGPRQEPPMFRQQAPEVSASDPKARKEGFVEKTIRQTENQILSQNQSFAKSEAGESNTQDRRADKASRHIGNVTSCSGSSVIIATEANNITSQDSDSWAVGQVITIRSAQARVVAMVREMRTDKSIWDDNGVNSVSVYADLLGEVNTNELGRPIFKRGVSKYPNVGALAHKIRMDDLKSIFDLGTKKGINVGTLSQNPSISASVAVDDILKRHVAIVGTTGVGKTCSVSLLIDRAIEADENLRVILLDPHNEFYKLFPDKAHVLDQNNLELPFWLLNYDELEDVIFRGRPIHDESDILREFIAIAKIMRNCDGDVISFGSAINVDTPVPYRIGDVIKLIDEQLGNLEPKFSRTLLRSLKVRIELILHNPRFGFMFGKVGRDDNFASIISKIFRLPSNGKPLSIINFAGLPNEIVNSVASVIARLSFEVARASEGNLKILLVCEEAHRYVPSDKELGFLPTRRAIARIAKEGRKYGCAIAVVTQRPGELDPTILSQCSTIFAMRLTNDKDQDIIRSALSDASVGVIKFLPSLDNREAIAFGEGVAVPMRLRFADYKYSNLASSDEKESDFNSERLNANALVKLVRGEEVHNLINQANAQQAASLNLSQNSQTSLIPDNIRKTFGMDNPVSKEAMQLQKRSSILKEGSDLEKSVLNNPIPPRESGPRISPDELRKKLW